jgi:hypothetical protein
VRCEALNISGEFFRAKRTSTPNHSDRAHGEQRISRPLRAPHCVDCRLASRIASAFLRGIRNTPEKN